MERMQKPGAARAGRGMRFWMLAMMGAAVLAAPRAAPAADEILVLDVDQFFASALLPNGSASQARLSVALNQIAAHPSGKLYGVYDDPQQPAGRFILAEVLADGSVMPTGEIASPAFPYVEEKVLELAFDRAGRLYLLTTSSLPAGAGHRTRLMRLDPLTAATLNEIQVPSGIENLAAAPFGFWANSGGVLRHLDPETGLLGPLFQVIDPHFVTEIATDSAGDLWVLSGPFCQAGPIPLPTSHCLYKYDILTGIRTEASPSLTAGLSPYFYELTIHPACRKQSC